MTDHDVEIMRRNGLELAKLVYGAASIAPFVTKASKGYRATTVVRGAVTIDGKRYSFERTIKVQLKEEK